MLLLEGYISNFTCALLLYVEFSDFYVNQSLAGQTNEKKIRQNGFRNALMQIKSEHV
jgi:hypothetical protein